MFVVRVFLFVMCCPQCAACKSLRVVCNVVPVVGCLWCVVGCCLMCGVRCLLFVGCYTLCDVCCLLFVVCCGCCCLVLFGV